MGEFLSADVFIQEEQSDVHTIQPTGTTTAGFAGLAPKGKVGKPELVTSFAQYRRFYGGFDVNFDLAYGVAGFFRKIRGRCYVVRTAHYTDITDASTLIAVASNATLKDKAGTPLNTVKLYASSEGVWGDSIQVVITDATNVAVADGGFKAQVLYNGALVETLDDIVMTQGVRDYIENRLSVGKSAYIWAEDLLSLTPAPNNRPANGTFLLTSGNDGLVGLDDTDIIGSSASKTGLYALDRIDDLNTVCAPGFTSQVIHNGIITYSELRQDIVGVLDPPLAMKPMDIKTYVRETAAFNSKYACIYYPNLVEYDPVTKTRRLVPPSGQICGIFAKTDVDRGVHKAPAGTRDGQLSEVIDLEYVVDKGEMDVLYPARINPIVKKPGYGFLVWGNKTLSGESDWRSLNVRRLFNFVEKSIADGTQWAVFEPNNKDLWDRLRNSIGIFLLGRWREGMFYDGGTGDPSKAFYVKCDADLNTQSVIDEYKVITEIGAAPTKAAEFVIIRIHQWDGGRLIEELAA